MAGPGCSCVTSSGEMRLEPATQCFGECRIDEETKLIANAEALYGRQMAFLAATW